MAAIHVRAWARPSPAAIPTHELPTTQRTCVRTRSRRRSWRCRECCSTAAGRFRDMVQEWSHGWAGVFTIFRLFVWRCLLRLRGTLVYLSDAEGWTRLLAMEKISLRVIRIAAGAVAVAMWCCVVSAQMGDMPGMRHHHD